MSTADLEKLFPGFISTLATYLLMRKVTLLYKDAGGKTFFEKIRERPQVGTELEIF